jgi:hypothetical protein
MSIHTMKKVVVTMFVLFVLGVNVFLLLPTRSAQDKTEGSSALKCPQIELSEVNPGIFLHLLKS